MHIFSKYTYLCKHTPKAQSLFLKVSNYHLWKDVLSFKTMTILNGGGPSKYNMQHISNLCTFNICITSIFQCGPDHALRIFCNPSKSFQCVRWIIPKKQSKRASHDRCWTGIQTHITRSNKSWVWLEFGIVWLFGGELKLQVKHPTCKAVIFGALWLADSKRWGAVMVRFVGLERKILER